MQELKCIGIISDGNRRYSQKYGIPLHKAYAIGTKKAWDVIEWLQDYEEIKHGIFYTLSLENFQRRSRLELKILFRIFERELEKIKKKNYFEKFGICLRFIGKVSLLPKYLSKKMEEVEKITENNGPKNLYLAVCYNGQQEIIDAAKRIAKMVKDGAVKVSEINQKLFSSMLYANIPFPDLIVRTGNTKRLSGFLTFQSAYAELEFIQKLWPEITREDLDKAISSFYKRQRRFGK